MLNRLKKPYIRILIPGSGSGYFATILEFQGCYAEGETAEEAMRNLEEVAESWIEATLEQGQDIPEPFPFRELRELVRRKEPNNDW